MKLLVLLALLLEVTLSIRKTKHIHTHEFINSNGQKKIARLEENDPGVLGCDTVSQKSGYFSAGGNKEYFYWFFESRNSPSTSPFIMWLTGGPGCSSILALLVENGPCYVNEWATGPIYSETSWNTNANLLYVDQPPGTGFSTGTYDDNEDEVANDMYTFLQAFIKAYPSYFKESFYVFGESYGGHWVPNIAHRIFTNNNAGNGTYIPLAGFGIGNGLTDPYIQFAYYATMAYNSTTAPSVISKQTYDLMTAQIPTCQQKIELCNTAGTTQDCDDAYTFCTTWELDPVEATGVNPYDLRVPCGDESLCYNFTNVDLWLNNKTVQNALGVNKKWEECSTPVNERFESDWMKDYQTELPPMLESGIRGLIYAGDQDFICNWLGNQAWALQLNWKHQSDFDNAQVKTWSPDGTARGNIRTAYNFTFLQVFQAGHMVPMNQPQSAFLMVNEFLTDTLY